MRALFDWLCRDRRTDRIVIAQAPNVALWIFLVTVALGWAVPRDSTLRAVIEWIGLVALIWWSLDEVARGVNPLRRLIGVGGCVICALKLVSLLR